MLDYEEDEAADAKASLAGRLFLGLLVLVALVAMGAAALRILRPEIPDPVVPAVLNRDTSEKRSESVGVLEPSDRDAITGYPADSPLPDPLRFEGVGEDLLFEWQAEEGAEEVEITDRWVNRPLGDESIELVAFATWYPHPEDVLPSEADWKNWKVNPVFRDATTLEVLDGARLDTLGIPASFRELIPPQHYQTPKMRLLFRTRGIEHPRIIEIVGGDVGTGAEVTYSSGSLDDDFPETGTAGEWTYFDVVLLAWHEMKVRLLVRLLTGEPEIRELPRTPGAQVAFGGTRLRTQWLADLDGRLETKYSPSGFEPIATLDKAEREALEKRIEGLDAWSENYNGSAPEEEGSKGLMVWLEPERPDGYLPQSVLRTTSSDYHDGHVGLVREDGEVDWDWRTDSQGGVDFATNASPEDPSKPLRLLFIPHITEVEFELPGLPDSPNQVVPGDLMDLVLPRVSLSSGTGAESELLGMFSVAAQLAWDIETLWDDDGIPRAFPADQTFRNQTVGDLLEWYLTETRGSTLHYEPAQLHFDFNRKKESWWDGVLEWIDDNWPL